MTMLLSLGCKTMREGVIATIIFFIAGILLILASIQIVPALWHLNHIILLAGFLLLLFAPIILVSTFLISVLPNAKKRMENCEH
jgi:hypothetical protein